MNKSDLIEELSKQADIPKTKSASYVNILINLISDALVEEKKVTISDFGTFQVSVRKSFSGRNPKTGEDVIISARRVVTFRAGNKLRKKIDSQND